ncbi:MAG: caspase family protein [Acidobacteriota bacterium]
MKARDSHAVLIGIRDYSRLDASLGQAPGTSDLPASPADVSDVHSLCTRVGIPARNIRVLSDPPARGRGGHDDAQPTTPTRAAICSAVRWLAERMREHPHGQSLIYFTGHGMSSNGPVLCPQDIERAGDSYSNELPLRELGEILNEEAEGIGATTILDTCHSSIIPNDVEPSSSSSTPFGVGALRSEDVLLAACQSDQQAAAIAVDRRIRSAFTWSLMRVLDQFARVRLPRHVVIDISYREAVRRAGLLLQAFELDQRPAFSGRPRRRHWPVLSPFVTRPPEALERRAPEDDKEIYPDENSYVIREDYDIDSTKLGRLDASQGTEDSWYSDTSQPIDQRSTPFYVHAPDDKSNSGTLSAAYAAATFGATTVSATPSGQLWKISGMDGDGNKTLLGYFVFGSGSSPSEWWLVSDIKTDSDKAAYVCANMDGTFVVQVPEGCCLRFKPASGADTDQYYHLSCATTYSSR